MIHDSLNICVFVSGLLKPSQIIMSDPLIKEATKLKVSLHLFYLVSFCSLFVCNMVTKKMYLHVICTVARLWKLIT